MSICPKIDKFTTKVFVLRSPRLVGCVFSGNPTQFLSEVYMINLLHCALSCAMYFNRPCLFVCLCVCLFVCGSALLQPARSVCVASERFFIIKVIVGLLISGLIRLLIIFNTDAI